MTVGSGRKLLELFDGFIPAGSWQRTLLESLVLNPAIHSSLCWLRWKQRAMKSSRLLFQLAPSAPGTGGIESGLLPTTRTSDANGTGDHGDGGLDLRTTIAILPTAHGDRMGKVREKLAMLPTPRANKTGGIDGVDKDGRPFHPSLHNVIAMLPTPRVSDHKDTGNMENVPENGYLGRRLGKSHGLKLQPEFAEVMMGFPIGWTDLGDSETPSSRKSR